MYLVNINVVTTDQLVGRHSEHLTNVLLLMLNAQFKYNVYWLQNSNIVNSSGQVWTNQK